MKVSRLLAMCMTAGLASTVAAQVFQGPSTQQLPYLTPSDPSATGVQVWSIASNGNGISAADEVYPRLNVAGNPLNYRFVGIPDGMGAFRSAQDLIDDTFTVLVNHELGDAQGIVRDHGSRGAFVSLWRINRNPASPDFLKVIGAQDLGQKVFLWNIAQAQFVEFGPTNPMPKYVQNATNGAQGWDTNNPGRDGFGRHCSADLAPVSAFQFGTLGTDARIFLNGEEFGAQGRAFAYVASGPEFGNIYELPYLADFSWENSLACPFPQTKTIVMGTDDSGGGQMYMYVGNKQATGNVIEKAGLQFGKTYGMVVAGITAESTANVLGTAAQGLVETKPFTMVDLGDVVTITGTQLQANSDAAGVLGLNRPEDGHWDTVRSNRFYFATTASLTTPSRLWAMDFTDITQPELGGQLTMLIDGKRVTGAGATVSSFTSFAVPASGSFPAIPAPTTIEMMDNFGVTKSGQIIIEEDVGGDARLGRTWLYNPANDSVVEIFRSRRELYQTPTGGSVAFTTNEEASGAISAEDLIGPGWHLENMQAHYAISGELVEGGDLMATFLPQTLIGAGCYANCDGSTSGAILSPADFTCFLGRYRAGDTYADCDVSGGLSPADFTCFLSRYRNGCN